MLEALRRWANDELRSANGQLEFILRRALAEAGRLKLIAGGVVDAPGEVPDD